MRSSFFNLSSIVIDLKGLISISKDSICVLLVAILDSYSDVICRILASNSIFDELYLLYIML